MRLDLSEPYPVPERVSDQRAGGGCDLPRALPQRRDARRLRRGARQDLPPEALRRDIREGSGEDPCFYGQMGRCAPCLGMDEERVPPGGRRRDDRPAARRGRRRAPRGARGRAGAALARARVRGRRALQGPDRRHRADTPRAGRRERRGRCRPSWPRPPSPASSRSSCSRRGGSSCTRVSRVGDRRRASRPSPKRCWPGTRASAGRRAKDELPTADEDRVVSAYLRRRVASFEAVRLEGRGISWRPSSGWSANPP